MATTPQADFDVGNLRESLAGHLPDYMIPSSFVLMETIPLTASGKIDRKALAELEMEGIRPIPAASYAPPETETEKLLAKTWKEILKLDRVGIHDNFFDLGGNSYNIVKLNSKINEMFPEDIAIVEMFRHSTIHTLAKFLDEKVNQTHDNESSFPEKRKRFEILVNTNKLIRQKTRN
jgi:hypothetical protein